MVGVRAIAFAGVGLFATAAHAADMPQLMPPPPMPYHEDFARGWYLRGDIGMSNQKVGPVSQRALYRLRPNSVQNVFKDFDSALDLRPGRRLSVQQLAARPTSPASIAARLIPRATYRQHYLGGNTFFTDEYRGNKSEWLVLANVYADLGTWGAFTPFIGVGIGGSLQHDQQFLQDGYLHDLCPLAGGRRARWLGFEI